ncbi:DNA-binding response regulator [Sporanaerobium hydrogeniformans]|uniref:DNA-binding response regulator n=1 Tax=Sporanaerobium hydrogeniformans TaxID=3072179 RepID=A0AC61D9X2_9FIRM|nr:response regulator transcription factor [Sporanaerobium hydrogeniformans]PHV70020.1 DNA-binding response regulator [Sporanaerobium hydrogeniformans]
MKLAIVDDDILIRESLKIIIGADEEIEVVATASNGKEAISLIEKENLEVLLLDLRMPIMDGIQVLKYLQKRKKVLPVLVLTTFDEDELIREAIGNGAAGFLLKNSTPDKIIAAIKAVFAGNGAFEKEVVHKLNSNLRAYQNKMTAYGLTARELEIVESIAEGLSNKEIATKLYISEGTVKNYITSILTKMNLTHRTQIAITYLR